MKRTTAGTTAFVMLALATLGAACSHDSTTEPTQTTVAALTGPQQFTIRLPDAAGLPGVAIAATDTLRVSDSVSLVSPSSGFVSMTNTGTVQTDVGTDTRLGNIFSQSAVVIRDRSQVAGDVQSAATVQLVNGASVAGTVKEHVPLVAPQTFSWQVNFPTPGANVNLEPAQTRVLAPGSYGDVTVKSSAVLRLSPGTFYVNSFSVEPQATIVADAGPVLLYVASGMNFKGAISAGTQARNFLVGVAGTGTVFLEAPFTGTIVAPNATIRFATVTGTGYTGSFFGRGIDLQPSSVVTLNTFGGWEDLFPVPGGRPVNIHPRVVCVAPQNGNLRAVFGYVNDGFDVLQLPVGPSNAFSPAPLGRGQIQTFLIGRHEAEFATVFSGAITWTTPGGSATANAQSPLCPSTTCAPACATGEACVGGRCVTLCGDNACAGEEGCDSCLGDCACAGSEVCFHNGCANPIRCGKDWQCGSGTEFGVSVNCGACSAGTTCVNHVCK